MDGPLRSKQGCWTCRLRKKKCDEARPKCTTCESLSITCYGFGPKPDWMSDSKKERAIANSLKEVVKQTSRRKPTTQSSKQPDPVIRIAPKPRNASVENFSSIPIVNHQDGVIPVLYHGLSLEDGHDVSQDKSINKPLPEHGDGMGAAYICSISEDDSALLMNFLDNVFPLQYPMYKSRILEGGRGWLFALLLRTKPLYHAALALSVHHRRATTLENSDYPYQVSSLVLQESHLEICIKAVNYASQNSCPTNGPAILTSVIQLVFFELFTGNGNKWQPHLGAAMNMYQRGHEKNLSLIGLSETSRIVLCEDLPLPPNDPKTTEQVTNFRFSAGTLIWLDITSSITSGTTPTLLRFHPHVIASSSHTRLEDIMGCKNWVMLQIGRFAALHGQKSQPFPPAQFDCAQFGKNVDDISRDIQCGMTQGALEGFNISDQDSPSTFTAIPDTITLVTRIFAYMASVYLHLVVHGFQNLELLEAEISGTMRLLRAPISAQLLPALVSPLYIIGSVVPQEDEQFFRNVFSSPPLLDPSLLHRRRILPVLEAIWSRRRDATGFTWQDAVELSHCILLV